MKTLFFAIIAILIAVPHQFNVDPSQFSGKEMMAAVTLEDDYKPDYAPSFDFKDANTDKNKPVEFYVSFFLQLFAGSLLYLAGPVAILVIAIGGLRYVTSHGDDSQLESAKKTLTYAIIGLLVIIFSYAIVQAVLRVLLEIGT